MINEHKAGGMGYIEPTVLNEQAIDPAQMSGEENILPGGVYKVAFNVTYPIKDKDYVTGRKTSYGILKPNFGSFKITAMYRDGEWKTLNYGPAIDENYGGERVTGLFVRITNDFGDGFATVMWDLVDRVENDFGPYAQFQVHIKIRLPNEKGAIIRQEHRGGIQYAHRCMLVGEPVVLGPDERENWIAISDDGMTFKTENYFGNLAVKDFETKEITPQNVAEFMVNARVQRQATTRTERPATARKSATEAAMAKTQEVKDMPDGSLEVNLKPIQAPIGLPGDDQDEVDRG